MNGPEIQSSCTTSFVSVEIKSNILPRILKKVIPEENTESRQIKFAPARLSIEIEDAYMDVPTDVGELVHTLLKLLFTEEEIEKAVEDADRASREACVFEITSNLEKIIDSIEEAEAAYQLLAWDEDTSRFNRNNYTPDVLEELDAQIAKNKHCNPEDITQKDFDDFVRDGISCDTTMFVYNKAQDIMQCGHSFEFSDEEF